MRLTFAMMLFAACATTTNEGPLIEEGPMTAQGGLSEGQRPETAPKRQGPIVLERKDVSRVLDRGPADFLASVDNDPLVQGGRFRGWIFRGWRDGRFAAADLVPGDVVSAINGKPIETPAQFKEIWDGLRTATELRIDIDRDGKPLTFRYPIKD